MISIRVLAPIVLLAATPALADPVASAWAPFPVASDAGLKDPLIQRGKAVFDARCGACHGPIAKDMRPGMPPMAGTQALKAKYKGEKPELLEQRTDLKPEIVRNFVRRGSGFMPAFRPTELPDQDLAAVAAYLSRGKRR